MAQFNDTFTANITDLKREMIGLLLNELEKKRKKRSWHNLMYTYNSDIPLKRLSSHDDLS